jgi:hypothetical protein
MSWTTTVMSAVGVFVVSSLHAATNVPSAIMGTSANSAIRIIRSTVTSKLEFRAEDKASVMPTRNYLESCTRRPDHSDIRVLTGYT